MKPVEVNVNLLYHLETENHRFFYVFRGVQKEILTRKGLNNNNIGESGTI